MAEGRINIFTPVWTEDIAYQESFMAMENARGIVEPIQLLYPATEVLEVKSSDLKITYSEGIDYILNQAGELEIPKGSRIVVTKHEDVFLKEEISGYSFAKLAGGYLYFSEDGFFHKRQTVITYKHETTWQGTIPKRQGNVLPKTRAKLERKEPLHVLVYGDSITAGGNASARLGVEPYLERFSDLIIEEWKKEYGYDEIRLTNTAVGGKDSEWGVQEAEKRVATYAPDLMILGFGMNGRAKTVRFKENMEEIIRVARSANPDCEIILIASMVPNQLLPYFVRKQAQYLTSTLEIAKENEGIAVADMTTMHFDLLKRKSFYDMTGNGVNHCNDYLTRVYAQVIMETMKL